ncbi:MAG: hypothetical protein COC01_09485 [Bacteroidetes bacterium]|nr:MAG: hypothetical protein COC01_09485 [Bacteroidota bacterium]
MFKKNRTNKHYLTLIRAIAFWNQKQRTVKQAPDGTRYIEADIEDVRWANHLAREALLRKSDELNPQLRSFFEKLKEAVEQKDTITFYARQIQREFRLYPMKMNRHLRELTNWGLIKRSGGNYKTSYEYEIVIWDDYNKLKKGMDILDETYEKIKERYGKGQPAIQA